MSMTAKTMNVDAALEYMDAVSHDLDPVVFERVIAALNAGGSPGTAFLFATNNKAAYSIVDLAMWAQGDVANRAAIIAGVKVGKLEVVRSKKNGYHMIRAVDHRFMDHNAWRYFDVDSDVVEVVSLTEALAAYR